MFNFYGCGRAFALVCGRLTLRVPRRLTQLIYSWQRVREILATFGQALRFCAENHVFTVNMLQSSRLFYLLA